MKASIFTVREPHYSALAIPEDAIDFSSINKYAAEQGFAKKSELHLTVIGVKTYLKIEEALVLVQNKEKRVMVEHELLGTSWSFDLQPKFFRLSSRRLGLNSQSDEEEESIIQLASVPLLDDFYRRVNQSLHLNLPVQFAHVTLFTKGKSHAHAEGIPINSLVEFEALHPEPIAV